MSDAPLVATPVYGLRTWIVSGERPDERLAGSYRGAPWPAGGAWLEASCLSAEGHSAPAPECGCGVHACVASAPAGGAADPRRPARSTRHCRGPRQSNIRANLLRVAAAIVVAALLVVLGLVVTDPPGERTLNGRSGEVPSR
jgi:hypothetical protein